MKANNSPAWFYLGHYDHSDPFGSYAGGRNPNGPGHLGSDFNGMPEGTQIPAFCNWVFFAKGYNSFIGHWLTLRTPEGYAFVYHMQQPSPLNNRDSGLFGELWGYLGNTGSVSTGAHTHIGFSTTDSTAGTGAVTDPLPIIQAEINANLNQTVYNTKLGENDMAIMDGGYIVEVNAQSQTVRGAIWGPNVPDGVIVKSSFQIEDLQAMGNLAGLRAFDPKTGFGLRVGAPLKYVNHAEFEATVELAKSIFG